jgi:hypothetical protein
MNAWESKIIDAFISRYFIASAESGKENRITLRLRSLSIFPDFETAAPDDKESYLEAAETLERKGLLTLNWEKRSKGERLKTLSCADMGKLFVESGRKDPKSEAEEIRALFKAKAAASDDTGNRNPFLNHLSEHFGPSEAGRGIDLKTANDLARLLEVFYTPSGLRHLTTRALSISLYHDSKRLEHLLDLFNPLLTQARKTGIPAPDLSFLQRSLPETMISGKLIFEYNNNSSQPLVNNAGIILGFPLQSIREIRNIGSINAGDPPAVLTIENKETFYALADSRNFEQDALSGGLRINAFLYIGGYLNQAAAAMIKILAASGFRIYHAGDLDPDGILILQNIMDIAEKPVIPVGMDAAVFDRYLLWARPLTGTMLSQLKKIREDTKAVPGIADLIRRIEETRRGVEQEIIDYRGNSA